MKIFVCAGEVSGDAILSQILARLRERFPDMRLQGFGGEASARYGLRPLLPMSQTALNGVGDVLRHALFCLKLNRLAVRNLESFRPQLVLLVDYPGLNLRLARRAVELGIPVYYVAPPQVWAYRESARRTGRAAGALRGAVVHTLFPFEADAFKPFAKRVVSGHFLQEPSAPATPASARRGLLLCPGSRLSVLRRNLPAWLRLLDETGVFAGMTGTAGFDDARAPETITVLTRAHLEAEVRKFTQGYSVDVTIDKTKALAGARLAIAFPGTITLELAMHRIPTMALALLDPLTLLAGKMVLRGSRLAMPNLLLREDIFPEWAGTRRGLSRNEFARLWGSLTGKRIDWETCLSRLREVTGPSVGAEVAARECAGILEGIG